MTSIAHHLETTAKHVLISANPRSGRRPARLRVHGIEDMLQEEGFEVHVCTELDEVAALAHQWHEEGKLRAVVAAGGDGTAAGILNQIPPDVPLIPLPLGTANLLATYLGQTTDPLSVLHTVRDGVSVRLDAGRANGRLFVLMISAGFDAEVVRLMHSRRQGHITKIDYVKPTFQTIRSYDFPELRLYSEAPSGGESEAIHCRWMFGFNLPRYACGLNFAPEAVGTDGMLDVCTFDRGSFWQGLRYLWHVFRGSHVRQPDVAMARGRRFRIESTNGLPVTYQLDGDIGGQLPVEFEVVPQRITLLVTTETARRLGFQVGPVT